MNATKTQQWLLVVNRPQGGTSTFILSQDALRFVGAYARVPGIGDANGRLCFRPHPAG